VAGTTLDVEATDAGRTTPVVVGVLGRVVVGKSTVDLVTGATDGRVVGTFVVVAAAVVVADGVGTLVVEVGAIVAVDVVVDVVLAAGNVAVVVLLTVGASVVEVTGDIVVGIPIVVVTGDTIVVVGGVPTIVSMVETGTDGVVITGSTVVIIVCAAGIVVIGVTSRTFTSTVGTFGVWVAPTVVTTASVVAPVGAGIVSATVASAADLA
jgi:hypothetical protein